VWGGQLEEAATASSYIPTEGSTVTRTADDYKIDGTAFSDFWNAAEGTVVAEWEAEDTDTDQYPFEASDGTNDNRVSVRFEESDNSVRGFMWESASNPELIIRSISVPKRVRATLAFKDNDLTMAVDDNAVSGDTAATLSNSISQIQVGSNWADSFHAGKIYTLNYYPKRLPDTEVEALSGGKNLVDGEISTPKGGIDSQGIIHGYLAPGVPLYRSEIVELGGDFDAGEEVKCTRIGDQVTITSVGILTHSSLSKVDASSGVIPAAFRPSLNAGSTYHVDTSLVRTAAFVEVNSNGNLLTSYTKLDTGAPSTEASTLAAFSVTYNIT